MQIGYYLGFDFYPEWVREPLKGTRYMNNMRKLLFGRITLDVVLRTECGQALWIMLIIPGLWEAEVG